MAKQPRFRWSARWQPHAYGATKDFDSRAESWLTNHCEWNGRRLDTANEQAEGLQRDGSIRAWRCE